MSCVNLYVQSNGETQDSEGFWRLRLNQIPADIDTLQIKASTWSWTRPRFRTHRRENRQRSADGRRDPDVGHDGLENTILYWFEVPMAVRPNYVAYDKFQELRVRFTDITGATKKNNAFIVKNFGLWAFAK
eukprot:tig00021013_g17037.t1